jgi:DNA-directed RNA polymerase I, II, and III subunit RPABC5
MPIIPVRCFTCNKVIADLWEEYRRMTEEKNIHPKEAMNRLGLTKECCRRHMMTHRDLT